MAPRSLVGIAALACASVCGVLSTIAHYQMMDEVNEKLSKENQFEMLWWHGQKTHQLHQEYRRLYPDGKLSHKLSALYALALVSFLICVWCLGFFGK
jgi:hypothetical protein